MNTERVLAFISDRHKNIQGWFFPLDQIIFFELIALQNRFGIVGDLCEVGVYQGKSLVFLSLLKSPSDRLFGFDLFDDDTQSLTEQNLVAEGVTDNVLLTKGLTSQIPQASLDTMMSTPVRFLHVDAGHEYHEVLQQLELFAPFVAEQGLIAMDDYQDREFPGIEAAVLDFAERDRPRRFVPFLAGGNKMFLCNVSTASMLQKAIVNLPNFKDSCRLTRIRDFNVLILRSKLPVQSEAIIAQISALDFPRRVDGATTLTQKSETFSQLTFGSGDVC